MKKRFIQHVIDCIFNKFSIFGILQNIILNDSHRKKRFYLEFQNFEDGTNVLSCKVGNQLPILNSEDLRKRFLWL